MWACFFSYSLNYRRFAAGYALAILDCWPEKGSPFFVNRESKALLMFWRRGFFCLNRFYLTFISPAGCWGAGVRLYDSCMMLLSNFFCLSSLSYGIPRLWAYQSSRLSSDATYFILLCFRVILRSGKSLV